MSFDSIVGLEPAIRLLKGQIAKERLANTYLFTGPEGIGKRTLALELARALGTTEHDIVVVAPLEDKSEIGIDQVRGLEAKLSLTPHSSQWKVGIVDDAHTLTEEGMHGCLKLLEEPPPHSVVVLVTSAPHRLFATVVSRAHVVRCSPQGIEKVAAALKERAGLPADQARRLAVSAGGRMGMALELQEGKRLAARNAALDQMLAARSRGQIEISLAKVSREEVRENIEWYAGWWRDLLVLSLGGDPAWLVHQDRLDQLQKATIDTTELLLDRVDQAYFIHDAVGRNANVRTALAVLLSH